VKTSSDSSIEGQYLPATDSGTSTELIENLFRKAEHHQLKNDTSITSYYLENSTSEFIYFEFLSKKANALFRSAKDDVFEDGVESDFSRNLIDFITIYGHSAMETIIPIILSDRISTEIASEAFRVLGRLNHKATYRDRLWLLERGLYSTSARVRDGATLGLAFLNDSLAIPPLKSAIEREAIPELRQDMEQVLTQLEGNKDGISTPKDKKN